MISWLKRLLQEPDRFKIAPLQVPLPPCRIRPVRPQDFEVCEAIYRLNEPGRFPENYFAQFSERLRGGQDLFLVAEVDGQIRGLGGISSYNRQEVYVATLAFGMVDPEYHRKGFGTVLLLARLSTLPAPSPLFIAAITTTGGSATFYRRFGFWHVGRYPDARGEMFDNYRVRLYKPDWQACRAVLTQAGITLDTDKAVVPRIVVPRRPYRD